MVTFDRIVLEYVFYILSGMIIGIAVLGQFFVNEGAGKVGRNDSTKRRVTAYVVRIASALVSLVVLVLVIRTIRSSTTVTITNALVLAASLATTVVLGWKKWGKGTSSDKGPGSN